MMQWHPIFAQLLRPVVEAYYDVQTTVPVGDKPREADFVLLRRILQSPPPFKGLWRHLTPWNVMEFKGRTVSPRRGDIERLIEVGLGIDRRLRAEHGRQGQPQPEEVSFWYMASRLGPRVVADAERKLGRMEKIGGGLWRSQVWGRMVFLVSSMHLPVEEDSLPLHIVGKEPPATESAVAQLVVEQPELQRRYGGWLSVLHATAWKEIEAMVRKTGKFLDVDLEEAVDAMGLDRIINTVGINRVIELCGLQRVIDEVGEKEVIKHIGLDRWLANLSPAERKELKRRLQ